MEDIFCRIAKGEEKSFTAYSDDKLMVIMDIFPMSKGQALVIPKQHFVFFYEMSKDLIQHFYYIANITGKAMMKSFNPKAIAMLARGLRVPHYHLILMPIRNGDINDRFFSVLDAYSGFPKISIDELRSRLDYFNSLVLEGRPKVSEEELEKDREALSKAINEELEKSD
ncbi:MAG: HIT family protein [Caldisphaera sp.]|jgi:histidine triad (HIT) family protein|nr:MAG: hypothetical protein C0171_06940 [Caldisphaera sp.]